MLLTPDRWVILKIILNGTTEYKLFSGWHGGYLHGQSWRLNSGIKSYEERDGHVVIKGSNETIYKCDLKLEGMSPYMETVKFKLTKDNPVKISVIKYKTFKRIFNNA